MLQTEPGKLFRQLQVAFNARYPYLKIDLIKRPDGKAAYLPREELPAAVAATISMGTQQTVYTLEQDILEKTGLPVTVYRKFCNVWIETTLTSDWTLEQQNMEGKLLSEPNRTG